MLVADLWGPCSGVRWTTPHWSFEKEKRGERKIKGRCSTMFYSLSLAAALTVGHAFSKRNVRPEVCVLCSSTQIRLVPDLGNMNNSLERCVCGKGAAALSSWGMKRSGKVGQSEMIKVLGCKKTGGHFRKITRYFY